MVGDIKIDINIDPILRKMQETIELAKNQYYNKKLDNLTKEKFKEFDKKFINSIEQILPVNMSCLRPDDVISDLPLSEEQKAPYIARSRLLRSLAYYWFARYKSDIRFDTMNSVVYFQTFSQLAGLIIEYVGLYLDIKSHMLNTNMLNNGIIKRWESLYDDFKIHYNGFIEDSNSAFDADKFMLSKIPNRADLSSASEED